METEPAEPEEPEEPPEPKRTPKPEEPPEPEDIALERDEDEAHHALMQRERFADEFEAPEAPRSGPGHGRDDSPDLLELDDEIRDAEPAAVEFAAAEDPRAFAPIEEEVREDARTAAAAGYVPPMFGGPIAGERPRPAVLPMAVMLVVGMLIGLAAGYAIFGGDRDGSTPPRVASAAPQQQQPPSGQAGPFTEQQVAQQPPQTPAAQPATLPATPPPVPAETAASPPTPESKPATPAATRGTIVVGSTPAGASVTVNGRWRGRTPLTLGDLPFGPYTVRVVQSGYAVAREEFRLSAGEPSHTMSVRLRRSSAPSQPGASPTPPSARASVGVGSIYVDSRPRGARVFVDGNAIGVTPLRLGDVRAGSHTVRLELADHRTWTASRSVLAGQETRVTGSLERIR